MNKRVILPLILLCIWNNVIGQVFLNLDFEYWNDLKKEPRSWYAAGKGYDFIRDTLDFINGSNSLKIQVSDSSANFAILTGRIPIDLIRNKHVKISGYLKLNHVSKYTGIWVRVDSPNGPLHFDNMSDQMINGTSDWKKYSSEFFVDSNATNVFFGVLLSGDGSIWVDDLKIFVENQELVDKKLFNRQLTNEEISWFRNKIYPLNSFNPKDSNFSDLESIRQVFEDASIIALGEVTHGSKEIFSMKHRLLKYLINFHDFHIFSLEASMPETYRINDFVLNGRGNPSDLLDSLYFWTWNTEEVLGIINWMKNHNDRNPSKKVQFTGFDMQYTKQAEINIINFFQKNDTVLLNRFLSAKHTLDSLNENRYNSKTTGGLGSIPEIRYLQEGINEIKKIFESNSKYYIKNKEVTIEDCNWIYQNLNIVSQYIPTLSRISYSHRDSCMADNVDWIYQNNSNKKMVLWAHNGHIKLTSHAMGNVLENNHEEKYLSVGFAFFQGNYTAYGKNGLTAY